MCLCTTSSFPKKPLVDSSSTTDGTSMARSPLTSLSSACHPYRLFEEDHNNISIQEDETCFLLSIEMENVHESEVQISLRDNVLTISGFRRSRFCFDPDSFEDSERRTGTRRASSKRQRISRQLVIDPNAIDIDRAMASTWNGCYTLYAPKRRHQFR